MEYYTLEDLSIMFNKKLTYLKWLIKEHNIRCLFNLIKLNGHVRLGLAEKDLPKFREIIREREKANSSWTYASIECYERKMVCDETCSNYFICSTIPKINGMPPIKLKVIELYKLYGDPNQCLSKSTEDYTNIAENVID